MHTIVEVTTTIDNTDRLEALLTFATDTIPESADLAATCIICTFTVEALDHPLINFYPCLDAEAGAAHEYLIRYLCENCANKMERDRATAWTVAGDGNRPFPTPGLAITIHNHPAPTLPVVVQAGQGGTPSGNKSGSATRKDY